MGYRVEIPPIVDYNPKTYQCKKIKEKVVIDGDLTKAVWENAQWSELFEDIEGDLKPKPRFETRMKMLWDDEALYVGAELLGNEIWGNITERDAVIFHDNDFEIFIDPNSDTHNYVEFEMNVLNTVWDLLLTKPYRDNGLPINSLDIKGLETAVKVDGEINNANVKNVKWTCEVKIPFTTIAECVAQGAGAPKVGGFWRINFSRVQWLVDTVDGKFIKRINPETNGPYPEDNWVWSPTGIIAMHCPELWGYVFFCEGDESYSISEDEYRKWELRKMYYAQHKHYDDHGHFDVKLKSQKEGMDVKIEVTSHDFEMATNSEEVGYELVIYADGRTDKLKKK